MSHLSVEGNKYEGEAEKASKKQAIKKANITFSKANAAVEDSAVKAHGKKAQHNTKLSFGSEGWRPGW